MQTKQKKKYDRTKVKKSSIEHLTTLLKEKKLIIKWNKLINYLYYNSTQLKILFCTLEK